MDERTSAVPQYDPGLTGRLFNNMSALGRLLVECLLLDGVHNELMNELLETACKLQQQGGCCWVAQKVNSRPAITSTLLVPPHYAHRCMVRLCCSHLRSSVGVQSGFSWKERDDHPSHKLIHPRWYSLFNSPPVLCNLYTRASRPKQPRIPIRSLGLSFRLPFIL